MTTLIVGRAGRAAMAAASHAFNARSGAQATTRPRGSPGSTRV
jgi:hypothetical protein